MKLTLITHVADVVNAWAEKLPEPKKAGFTCDELTAGTGLTMKQLHTPLQLLGWTRNSVWSRQNGKRIRRVLYTPPGVSLPRSPRGRPVFCLSDYLKIII